MGLIAVLGSGMAALGASYRLRQEGAAHVLFDMNDHLGGHTASHADATGFVFDEGPHISFTKDTRIQKLLEENVRGEFELFRARVNNYWKGTWIKHPAQCNLHGLPTGFLVKILMDMIETKYKPALPRQDSDGHDRDEIQTRVAAAHQLCRVADRELRSDVRRAFSDGVRPQVPHD
jgi:protoporphyrinogen oxidase